MRRGASLGLRAVALAAALLFAAAAPTSGLMVIHDEQFFHGQWTDAEGVPCLSDENYWERTWYSDRTFTGTLTASVYLCPENPNAPSGPNHVDIWASFATANGSGSASLTLTYPDGTIVAARPNPVTGWTEVCVVPLDGNIYGDDRVPGVYIMTFTANKTRSTVVHLDTDFAEVVRGQYWWGCDPSWFES